VHYILQTYITSLNALHQEVAKSRREVTPKFGVGRLLIVLHREYVLQNVIQVLGFAETLWSDHSYGRKWIWCLEIL